MDADVELSFYLQTAAMIWFNPLIIFPYFFAAAGRSSLAQRMDSNCTRLRVAPYLLIAPLVFCIAVGFMYLVLSSIDPRLDWKLLLEPTQRWVFYAGTATAMLSAAAMFSKQGLEGNIVGFIFAPFWLFSIAATIVAHLTWLNRVVVG